MSEEELRAIEERASASSPPPWKRDGMEIVKGRRIVARVAPHGLLTSREFGDFDFIASAREDVPALIAEVRALRDHNDRLAADYQDVFTSLGVLERRGDRYRRIAEYYRAALAWEDYRSGGAWPVPPDFPDPRGIEEDVRRALRRD